MRSSISHSYIDKSLVNTHPSVRYVTEIRRGQGESTRMCVVAQETEKIGRDVGRETI